MLGHGCCVMVRACARGGYLLRVGVAVVALLLAYEHRLVRAGDLSRLDAAFFTMNGVISISFFVLVLIDRLLHARALPITN